MIRLTTNFGVIDLELDYEHAPATSKNFEQYVRDGFYNNTIFHRVIYTIAMARTSDPHSATAQFFINVADNDFLNHTAPTPQGWGYAVFGKVIAGEKTVDDIARVKTGRWGFYDDVPKDNVIIEKAEVIED